MSKGRRNFLIVCGIVFVVGMFMALAGVALGGAKVVAEETGFIGNKSMNMYIKTVKVKAFENVNVVSNNSDVQFVENNENGYKVECTYPKNKEAQSAIVSGKTLKINDENSENDSNMGFTFGKHSWPKVTVYYPAGTTMGEIAVEGKVSDIEMGNMKATDVSLRSNYGDIKGNELTADKLKIFDKSGDVKLSNIAIKKLNITSKYGDVGLSNAVVGTGVIELKCGDIKGTSINSKGLAITSKYGSAKIAGTLNGKTKISCLEGDINLESEVSKEECNYSLDTLDGDIYVNNENTGKIKVNNKAKNTIILNNKLGDIKLNQI